MLNGAIIEQYIGKAGRKLFFLFAWIFSLLVIAAFADIVATTFNGINSDGSLNTPNAAAASISMLFIVVAMAFGLFIKYKKPSGKLQFFIGVVLLVVAGYAAKGGVMPEGTPFAIFASNVAGFLGLFGIPEDIAACIMTMCVSALALTSLDSVARIGRMSFQEFFC